MKRHQWYLEETQIPLALTDLKIPEYERAAIAKKLSQTPLPNNFRHTSKQDILEGLDFTKDKPPALVIK